MPRPARLDVRVNYTGTIDLLIRFKADGEAMDLTGWAVRATAGTLAFGSAPVLGGSGITVTDPTTGEVELYINSTDVSALTLPVVLKVTLTNPAGDPNPYLVGRILEFTE